MHLISRDTEHPQQSGESPFNQHLKDSIALSDSSIQWSGLRFGGNILVIFVLLLLMLPVVATGQTEVEGEVSGEWTAEDSPYIVVDSTWVPNGDTLSIGAGVQILFRDGNGLTVSGLLLAYGDEDNITTFLPDEEDDEWEGIYIHDDATADLSYCIIDNAVSCFIYGEQSGIRITHCELSSSGSPFEKFCRRSDSLVLVIEDSHIEGGGHIEFGYWVSLTATNTFVRCGSGEDWGIYTSGGVLNIQNCVIYGICGSESQIISSFENSRFLTINDTIRAGVRVTRRMVDCYVEGVVALAGRELQFESNEVIGYVWGTSVHGVLINNRIVGYVDFNFNNRLQIEDTEITGDFDFSGESCRIRDCHFGDDVSFYADSVFMEDCIIEGSYGHSSGILSIIRNCEILNLNGSDVGMLFNLRNQDGYVELERCFSGGKLSIRRSGQININNCTITTGYLRSFMMRLYCGDTYNIDNTIFYYFGANHNASFLLVSPDYNFDDFDFEYNNVWNFEYLLDQGSRNQGVEFEPDETNIFDDPIILSPFEPYLKCGSPCIDAGNPESPLDPDSTRADIGKYYYHHQSYIYKPELTDIGNFKILSLNPNPFNSYINMDILTQRGNDIYVTIYDISGRIVKNLAFNSNSEGLHSTTVQTHDLSGGCYFLVVRNGSKSYSRTIHLIH